MQCPVCENVALSISSREGIEIDFCPQCRGVWLDRGELDKIIERAAPVGAAAAPPPPPRYEEPRREERYRDDDDDRYRGGGSDKRRKRRSFLDDLFDFD